MTPSVFVTLAELPLSLNGKVNLKKLPVPQEIRPDLATAYARPGSETERRVAQVWQSVLPVDKVGINDNFFDLGGHSLLLVQVHSQLKEFYPQLGLIDLFQYPTVKTLAAYLQPKAPGQTKAAFEQMQSLAQKQRDARNRRRPESQ